MRSGKASETGCVILFWPPQPRSRQRTKVQPARRAVGLCEPRLTREDGDHRRRRLVHALGLAYCLILAAAGVWLVNELNEMKRVQDCVLSGRSRCIAIDVVAHSD